MKHYNPWNKGTVVSRTNIFSDWLINIKFYWLSTVKRSRCQSWSIFVTTEPQLVFIWALWMTPVPNDVNNWKDCRDTEQNPHHETISHNHSLPIQETPSKNLQLLFPQVGKNSWGRSSVYSDFPNYLSRSQYLLETLRFDNGDGKENAKKSKRLSEQTPILHVTHFLHISHLIPYRYCMTTA